MVSIMKNRDLNKGSPMTRLSMLENEEVIEKAINASFGLGGREPDRRFL